MINNTHNEDLSTSVVVPFYNRSKFLRRLLDSVAQQTLPADKVYIIDNGSSLEETISAWKIITDHSLYDKCVFTSSVGKGNANYARNLGYELADTKYVAFLDSDDWWEKEHLNKSINCLMHSNKAAIYSGAIIHSPNGAIISKSINIDLLDDPFSLILNGYIAQTSSYVVNKSILKEVVKWDESLKRHQDFDYFASIFFESKGWCFQPQPYVNIDWIGGGSNKKNIHFDSLTKFYLKWNSLIPDHIKPKYLKSQLYFSYRFDAPNNIKMFYKDQMKSNNYFNSLGYKIKSHSNYIKLYLISSKTLDRTGLKNIIRNLYRRIF